MGRASVREDKNIFQTCREKCGLTRSAASEAMEWVSESRIEKIESGKSAASPDEVMAMASAYHHPELCNIYCSSECAIGRKYVTQVESKPIEKIVLETIAELNNLEKKKDRLIEIASDGVIHDDEIPDFVDISRRLEHISVMADSLRLWLDKTMDSGEINKDILKKTLETK